MMENNIGTRFKNAWNAFNNKPQNQVIPYNYNRGYYNRPDRIRLTRGNERSIITSVFNRVAIDVASVKIRHCYVDENECFIGEHDSNLNNCLSLETNIDQTPRAFIQDATMSMFDEGSVALVPIETKLDPTKSSSIDIYSMRVGKIITWYPRHVRVEVYNDRTGLKEELTLPKSAVAIIENPLYAIMNEPNSTLQRLIRKLNLLDVIDEQSGSGKLDLIIQLPYIVKSEARKAQAEKRRSEIESQLTNSKYGVAYTDGTEKITQLNRAVENNLMNQIEYLTSMLYSQLGITQTILDGTADEKTMLNYNNRTVEPIVSAIVDEMKRKFLTKTARSQGQAIKYFSDPFKLVPVNNIAEIADKFTRNEILTSNEVRQIVGIRPSDDPKANMLMNSNINQSNNGMIDPNIQDQNNQQEDYDETINNNMEGGIQNG